MLVPRFYEDLNVMHDKTMPARTYYIPASVRMNDLVEHRERSDRFQLLNGEWKFQYYNSIYDVTESFYEKGYDVSGFDQVTVPSVWQMDGYDTHQYTNIRYPFPFDPPYVPQDIPCGAYVHNFEYHREEKASKAFLNFEGVDSCFYVWVNGAYAGYSQVPHATSEFDVTDLLNEGENTLAVLVLKWCDGSYLEDQDKFRMSGIFRDVYLLKRPEKTIRDYYITTDVEKDSVVVKLDMHFAEPVETKVTIEDKYGAVVARGGTAENGVLELTVLNPVLWNAENPYLYQVILTMPDEVIVDRIGFRTIEIKDKVVYFNGEKIKFRGVNRHDSDPETGFVISIQQIKKDLMLMKQHNFNAIRSSHYPNAPQFYQMCDEYGFMVIDEADIEAHGPFMLYRKEDTDQNRFHRWNEKIADDPAWEKAIVDRVQLMVQRDKNRPSIVMWSMGNESAYGCNFEKALAWTKKFDPDRITQYESARYRNYDITYNYDNLDLYSRMYPSLQEIEDYLKNDGSKPFLLVEYCHSMGNGPGDFEDYFQMIHKDDRMCGGFVWEWCDHAIAHGTAENGKTRYYYGGDHGETIHDGNFCMDGLVYPDRTPHTGLLEYKNVYRPVRIVSYDQENGQIVLHNYMDFDDLKDYVDIFYHHRMDPETPLEETMGALATAVCQGKALYVGLSNYDGETLEQAAAILKDLKCPFVINQNCYSIFDRTVEKNGLKDMTGNLKKGLITFSPLAQGQLTDRYLNGIPEDSRIRKDGRFLKESILTAERMEQIRKLNELAAQRGEKLADMALAWLLQKKEVTSVLIGASKTQQILDNIKAIHSAPFTEEELQKIDEYSL